MSISVYLGNKEEKKIIFRKKTPCNFSTVVILRDFTFYLVEATSNDLGMNPTPDSPEQHAIWVIPCNQIGPRMVKKKNSEKKAL